jgi:diguanylate cyclase (GGDEF)-like protein
MIDIDFFKSYNDTFGHQQGDQCLQQMATCIKTLIKRPGDFVARYGGEEFAVILPDTRMQGAYELMHELQNRILELHIPAADKSVSAFMTISIGIACMVPETTDDLHDFVMAADAALYSAKHKGRNRIETDNIDPKVRLQKS